MAASHTGRVIQSTWRTPRPSRNDPAGGAAAGRRRRPHVARERLLTGYRPCSCGAAHRPHRDRPAWRQQGHCSADRSRVHGQSPGAGYPAPVARPAAQRRRRRDGSRGAARTAADAIPLLRLELVLILVVDARDIGGRAGDRPGGGSDPPPPASTREVRLAKRWRQYHGRPPRPGSRRAADLLVMGGYGHSRLREMLIGGYTLHPRAHDCARPVRA
jgi:nucleotide-binding universal stress UspA family protein